MKMTRLATLALSFGLAAIAGTAVAQGYGPPPGPPPYGQRGGWDAPPQELREFQRQGFLDGVQGAQRDFENHRIWNVKNRDEYRHPNVPRNVRADYRDGFRKGYYSAVRHFQNGGPGRGYGPR